MAGWAKRKHDGGLWLLGPEILQLKTILSPDYNTKLISDYETKSMHPYPLSL